MGAPLEKYRHKELFEVHDSMTDAEWEDHIRARADTIYHPVGTCAMGTHAMAVVDPELRVRGLDGLRVADAERDAELISGNTNAPTIMIAEKAADMIRGVKPPPGRCERRRRGCGPIVSRRPASGAAPSYIFASGPRGEATRRTRARDEPRVFANGETHSNGRYFRSFCPVISPKGGNRLASRRINNGSCARSSTKLVSTSTLP